jgi:hypothetical protein
VKDVIGTSTCPIAPRHAESLFEAMHLRTIGRPKREWMVKNVVVPEYKLQVSH